MDDETKNSIIYQMQDHLDNLEHDYENLIEQIRLVNQQRFGCHTEKLKEIGDRWTDFHFYEAEENCDEASRS